MPENVTPDEPLTRPLADELSAAVAEDLENFDSVKAERDAEAAFESGTDMPHSGLLSFYDRLRERILHAIEKREGKRGAKLTEGTVRALLLVPDVFILLARLALDKNVPGSTRALIGGALAYFILPVDLLPEALLGGAGFMDDLVLATAVMAQAFGGDLEPYARKHWSGSEDLRVVFQDITEAAQSLLGQNLYDRLRKLLSRRGIEVEGGAKKRSKGKT
jgi:uncharacterized membrane protein YkvA (DUF1232 family)